MTDPRPLSAEEALQEAYDLGDQLDSNHARWCAMTVAQRLGVTIRVHNDFSEPPRNRNEEQIAALEATLAATPAPLDDLRAEVEHLPVTGMGHDIPRGMVLDAIDRATPAPLDVERLARAMARAEGDFVGKGSVWTFRAERIAAAYAEETK